MPRPISRSIRLALETMEHRLAPANNLEVVSPLETSVNITTTNDGLGTITISATAASAKLKITDLEDAMTTAGVTKVIVTTADPNAPDGGQSGDIVWGGADTGDLDFAGFGANRTLAFHAAGDIEFTDVQFVLNGDANNHSNLEFDTTAGNGDVRFLAGATNGVVFDERAVSSLLVAAGDGTITFENTPTPGGFAYARALGDIRFSGAAVMLANDDGVDAGGDIDVTATSVQIAAPLVADGDITVNGGSVALASIQSGRILPDQTVVAGGDISVNGTDVTLSSVFTIGAGNDIGITATSLDLGGSLGADGDIIVTGPVTLTGDVAIGGVSNQSNGASSSITLAGTVNGLHELKLSAVDVTILQSIGGEAELSALEFIAGDVQYAANALRATTITIGDNFLPLVSISGTGTLKGNVVVQPDATIFPGGDGTPGTLPIVGNLNFAGVLDIDLGPTSDLLHVTGNVSLSTSSSFIDVAGFLPSTTAVKVVDFSGTHSGHFLNVPEANKWPILTESDILTISNYGPAEKGITLAPFAIEFNAVGGNDFDGTGYIARLIGPGTLGAVIDANGDLSLATHGTTTASRIIVTTTANASDDVIRLGNMFIHGSLGAFTAVKVDAQISADNTIQSVTVRTLEGLTIGGQANHRTSVTAASIPGQVTTAGILSSIKVAGLISGDITASSIGVLRAHSVDGDITVGGVITSINTTAGYSGDLSAGSIGTAMIGTVLGRLGAAPADPRPTWNIGGRVGSLTASGISHFAVNALSLGSLFVNAKLNLGLGGHIADTFVKLTGNTGVSTGRMALKTVRVAGAVSDSLFDIEDGNVDSVTVGRFVNSRFYIGYDANGAFDVGGTFDVNKLGKLNKFTTTAKPLGQDFNPSNFAFVGSQVVANTFGKVLVSGLQTENNGAVFGFKFHTTPGSIRVAAGLPGHLLGVDLEPTPIPIGNFVLIAG